MTTSPQEPGVPDEGPLEPDLPNPEAPPQNPDEPPANEEDVLRDTRGRDSEVP